MRFACKRSGEEQRNTSENDRLTEVETTPAPFADADRLANSSESAPSVVPAYMYPPASQAYRYSDRPSRCVRLAACPLSPIF